VIPKTLKTKIIYYQLYLPIITVYKPNDQIEIELESNDQIEIVA